MVKLLTISQMQEVCGLHNARWLNVFPPLVSYQGESLFFSQQPPFLEWVKSKHQSEFHGQHLDDLQIGFHFKGHTLLCLIDIHHTNLIKPNFWFLVCDYNDKIEGPLEWEEKNALVSLPEFFNEVSLYTLGKELPNECWSRSAYTQEVHAHYLQRKLDTTMPSSDRLRTKSHL